MNEELKIIISAEVEKAKKSIDDAKKTIKDFKQQVSDASKDVDKKISSMGTAINKGFKTVATGAVAVGAALVAVGASTAEYRAEQAKLTSAFEAAGSSAAVAKDTYNDLYRVLGDSGKTTEAAAHLAKLTTEEKALAEWTNICQGVYATFGDSLPIESLTEAANETAKTGALTGALADALNWAGISEEAFSDKLEACNSEAEREKLIRETLNGVYSEAAEQYEKNNAQILAQNEAQAKLQETTAKLGEVVAPLVVAFTNFANEALAAVLPYIEELAINLLPVLQSALEVAANAIEKIMTFVSEHWELLATIGGVIAGIAAAIGIYNAVAAVKAAMDAAQVATLGALIASYLAQAAAVIVAIAPYLLIVAAIAAVIAIIVLCIKHWDEIKEAVSKAWQTIKEKTQEAVSAVVNWFNDMKQKISQKIEDIKNNITSKFEAIKTNITNKVQQAKENVVNKFEEIKSGATNKINETRNSVNQAFENMKANITEKLNSAKQTALNVFDNIKNGIQQKLNAAKDVVRNGIQAIRNFFNFQWSLPHIKLPHFSISGRFSLNPPQIPHFSVSWWKTGGVFDSPTLFPFGNGRIGGLGEDGAEAIVPLEKNTKWLDRMAKMLAEKQGVGTPIYLQVDGKTFAEISVDSINQLTRQRGSLPLKLM